MRPLVISGPSGVGKGTLYKLLFTQYPDTFTLSVSHTTRSPRPGEQDGVDYHYVTKEEFKELIAKDGFVEWYAHRRPTSFSILTQVVTVRSSETTCTAQARRRSRNRALKVR